MRDGILKETDSERRAALPKPRRRSFEEYFALWSIGFLAFLIFVIELGKRA